MKITIRKEVFNRLSPDFKVAFILIKDLDNKEHLKQSYHLLKEMEKFVRLNFNKESLKSHHLISPWVSAQEGFGKRAKHYPSSVEKLIRKVLRKREASSRNVVGNITNYLSLKHVVPMAHDDFDKIEKSLTIRLATGSEEKTILKKTYPGDLIYLDSKGLIGTKLDYWKSPRTRLMPSSKNALVHIEALPPITTKDFNKIVSEAVALLRRFSNGKIKKLVLTKNKNSDELK